MKVLGVDPGMNGAVVVYDGEKATCLRLSKATEQDIWQFIKDCGAERAVLEKVNAMPKQGVSSTFKFGMAYGRLIGFLVAAGISFQAIRPQDWQKGMGAIKATGQERKRRLKQEAERRFPQEKIVLENADAYLLAWFAYHT